MTEQNQAEPLDDQIAHEAPEFRAAVRAIICGEPGELERLLRKRPSLITERSQSEHQCTLLHYIASNGVEGQLCPESIYIQLQNCPHSQRDSLRERALGVARALIEAGAEVDAVCETYGGGHRQTTLCLLVSSGHPAEAKVHTDLIQVLADAGARLDGIDEDSAPLATALQFGYPRAAAKLVECGARTDGIVHAAAAGRLDQLQRFFDQEGQLRDNVETDPSSWSEDPTIAAEQALVFAAMCGQVQAIRFLLDRGVDVNADPPGSHVTGTALHSASDLATVKLLIERGANVHRREKTYRTTPFEWARVLGREEILEYLCGNFELSFGDAVSFGKTERVKELLEQDPDLACRQYGPGYLPLCEAAISGHLEVVRQLLAHGADPSQPDGNGDTASQLAKQCGHDKIIELLS